MDRNRHNYFVATNSAGDKFLIPIDGALTLSGVLPDENANLSLSVTRADNALWSTLAPLASMRLQAGVPPEQMRKEFNAFLTRIRNVFRTIPGLNVKQRNRLLDRVTILQDKWPELVSELQATTTEAVVAP